jgi:putative oxidoreductase
MNLPRSPVQFSNCTPCNQRTGRVIREDSFSPLDQDSRLLGIVLGLAGLGNAWRAAHQVWNAPAQSSAASGDRRSFRTCEWKIGKAIMVLGAQGARRPWPDTGGSFMQSRSIGIQQRPLSWLGRLTLAVAILMIGWGLSVVLTQPVTAWFAASATIWMVLLLLSAFWQLRDSFTSIAALALATAVVSRLFSVLRLNPPASIAGMNAQDLDLQVATGPGVPGFELLGWLLGALVLVQFILRSASIEAPANSREAWLNIAALAFIRVYVGLMFVPHFGSHILGGPFQFKIYTLYFASLGLHMPAIQVAVAGTVELICAVGLTLGLFTRPVALLGSVYLLMSMLWGGHFQIGYVWALPDGGYEFGLFWAVMIAVFAVLGGGPLSVDNTIRQSDFEGRWPWLRTARLLFA